MMGREYFTSTANRENSSDLLIGCASRRWNDHTEKQASLVDITVAIINSFQPIVTEYNGFLEKRKSKSWFKNHQDEVFLSFFCAVVDILRAWHHVDDSFDEQIRNRYPLIHNDFYIRNWHLSNEDLHFRNFHLRIGKEWDKSLRESGLKVKIPVALVAPVWFMNWMQTMIGWLEHFGKYGDELKPANLLAYFAE